MTDPVDNRRYPPRRTLPAGGASDSPFCDGSAEVVGALDRVEETHDFGECRHRVWSLIWVGGYCDADLVDTEIGERSEGGGDVVWCTCDERARTTVTGYAENIDRGNVEAALQRCRIPSLHFEGMIEIGDDVVEVVGAIGTGCSPVPAVCVAGAQRQHAGAGRCHDDGWSAGAGSAGMEPGVDSRVVFALEVGVSAPEEFMDDAS